MKRWLQYFQHNRDHRRSIPWELGVQLSPRLRRALVPSLQRFQVGESGEGHHLRRQAATAGDADYAEAIECFIREEQEHARLLARVLQALDAPLLRRHWTDGCFVMLRRLFDLNHELLVLLVPEMIAKRYFRALMDAATDPVLRAVFRQIGEDEEGHLAFHVDYLQRAWGSLSLPGRALRRLGWRLIFRAACLVVLLDHRAALKSAGVSVGRFWWDCGLIFDEVAAGIFSCMPTPVMARPGFQRGDVAPAARVA